MRKIRFAFVSVLALALLAFPAGAKVRTENGAYVVDDAEGSAVVENGNKAAAREDAKALACGNALVKVLDACAPGVTEKDGYAATREKLLSNATSLIKGFKATSEKVDKDGTMMLKGVCRISENALDSIIGPDVVSMLGNPRIMIFIDEVIGDKAPFISTTETEVLRLFEKAGYLIVDPSQARALLKLSAASAFNDPGLLAEAARTLRADIIIVGRAIAQPITHQKVHGVSMYRVGSTVQLKAVLTQTAYQISSKTVSQNTGKKPSLSLGEGAERCFKAAAGQAAGQILYKIAYSMASAGSALGGMTVNVHIADVTFQDVEAIEKRLKELPGASVFERSYSGGALELDLVSDRSARAVASLLAEQGIAVESVTAQTVSGRIKKDDDIVAQPQGAAIGVQITEIPSFEEAGVIEDALREFIGASGEVFGKYQDRTLELAIRFAGDKAVKSTRDVAAFLKDNGVTVDSLTSSLITGRAAPRKEKSGGLLW